MSKRAISRFPELYNPTTNNFQVWLAFLAFILFISTSLFNFSDGRWHWLDRLITDFTSIWFVFIFSIAIVLLLLTLLAFGSLIFITVRSFLKQKQEDSVLIRQDSLNNLVEQIKDLRKVKVMVDKCLTDIGDNDDKPTKIE